MKSYLDIIKHILNTGISKDDRTGTGTIAVVGAMFEHDMDDGFPLITTKRVPLNLVASELEFFIKGFTDKKWLQERNNHIWDEWCSPIKVPYSTDPDIQKKMKEVTDLGPIYGYQWRNFNGVDQFLNLINNIKTDPTSRRLLVSAWNPVDIPYMALPPCHYGFQVTILDGRLNLLWSQRSVDASLGLPFNIASYALLLILLAKETGYYPGKLVGFLADTHIYKNHIDSITNQLDRSPMMPPRIRLQNWNGIFNWKYTDVLLQNYYHHKGIKFDIAV